MTLETALVTRWLPWAAIVQLIAFVVLLRGLGWPPARGAMLAILAVGAAETGTALLAVNADPDLVIWEKVGFIATVGGSTISLLWFLWSRCGAVTARRCALLLGVVLLAFYLALLPYVRAVQPTASDEPHYLIVTQSLVLDGDLDLANDYAGDRYLQFTDGRLPDVHGIHVGTRIYTIRDLGLPVVAIPGFAVAGRTGVLVEVCLVGAYLMAMLFLLMRDLGLGPRSAVLAAGAAGMLQPIATYTTQVSPELFAAALFATALYALRRGRGASLVGFAVASACMGLIGIFSTRAWFIALGVGLCMAYYALRPDGPTRAGPRLARLFAAGVPFLLLLIATSAVNCWMFPFADGSGGCYFMPSAGYYLLRDQQQVLSYAPHVGVTGLLFDRTFGLISHTPLYLLAFVGLPSLVAALRSGRSPWLGPLVIASLILIGYIGSIAYWWADGAPPSRYLVVTVPLWVVALGYAIERLRIVRWGRLVVLGALVPSAVVTFIYFMTPAVRYDLAVEIAQGAPGKLWEEFATWFHWNAGLLFPSMPLADRSALLLSLVWSALALAFVELGVRLRRAAIAD